MNSNEKPNYILKFNEGILVPKNENYAKIKKAIIILIVIIVLGSIFFQENLFSEFPWTTKVLFISMAIGVLISNNSKRVPFAIEIHFFNDYLLIYREKLYYSKKISRKRYDKFLYKDIHECVYRKTTQRINIYGIDEATWYNYKKDGSLPNRPTLHKTVDSIVFFNTSQEPNIDFVEEIETHSPIKVIIENS
jgi:hypothetical protein